MIFLPIALDAGDLHAEMDADARRGVAELKIFRDFRGHRPRHHAHAELDHVDLEPLGARRRGEFEADEAGADHHDMVVIGHTVAQRLALVEGAQVAHIREIGVGKIKQAVARAGREHEMAVVERSARGEF